MRDRLGSCFGRRRRLIGAAAGVVVAATARLDAAEPRWPTDPYPYVVVDQELTDVLREFGGNLGLTVRVETGVAGRVRGKWPPMPPRAFLDRLARSYNFEWYYDGATLHVTPAAAARTRLLPLGAVPVDRLAAEMRGLGVADPRFPLRSGRGSDVVLVAGPPDYVRAVEQTLAALNDALNARVTVIRGRALDRNVMGGASAPSGGTGGVATPTNAAPPG